MLIFDVPLNVWLFAPVLYIFIYTIIPIWITMGFTVEPWAKEWLEEQRRNGAKCLEIKVSNGNHYVYRSTSRYDKESKGAKKVSEYLGSLDRDNGFVPKEKDAKKRTRITTVRETGTVRLLDRCAGDLFDILKNCFPDNYDQLYAMALMRCMKETPMKRASSYWERFENIKEIRPATSPKSLSQMLTDVGSDRNAQNRVFSRIDMECKELVFDLSEFFSASENMSFAETGYNPDHDDCPQINVAMVVTKDSGIPVMMRPLPGSVRDVRTVCATIKEMDRDDITLIMDRGFCANYNMDVLDASGLKFLIPVKRNNGLYDNVSVGEYDFFEYHERLIRYGKTQHEGRWLYRFKDESMATGEERAVFMKYKAGKILIEDVEKKKLTMGQMIIVSNVDADPEEIYTMYKRRDAVEKRFRTFKGTLDADSSYLRDDISAYGHIFVSFLSMYILAKLEDAIRKAGLLSRYSVEDVLTEYSKSYAVTADSGVIDYEIPNRLKIMDKKLGFNIFPILRS